MKALLKKKWIFIIMSLFVLINIILVVYNLVIQKQKKNEYQKFIQEQQGQLSGKKQYIPNVQSDSYNMPCPEIVTKDISGEIIDLRNFVGNVIIIRFSRFYKQDLSNLIYLQHLADKYKNHGVSLIFINSLGKHNKEAIDKIANIFYPIIEDDGSLSALFNAFPEDLIIIDRDFSIKFKYPLASKTVIFNEVIKFAFQSGSELTFDRNIELGKLIKKITFYDVIDGRKKTFDQFIQKNVILTIFTSTCTGCREDARIKLLKELSFKKNSERKIILLFGIGNNPDAIKQTALINGWDKSTIIVGVINYSDIDRIDDYYKLFRLDVDPRTFIINKKGEINFAENLENFRSINLNFLIRKT